MPLRLNRIELQLCMRMMDLASILRFARCCHATLAAASDPFPFRHTINPTPVDWPLAAASDRASSSASLLTRFVPVHLRLRPASPFTGTFGPNDVDALLSSSLRIGHLDASACLHLSTASWLRLLQSPLVRHVRVVTLHGADRRSRPDVSRRVLECLFNLEHVHTLNVGGLGSDLSIRSVFAGLPVPANLTSLSLRDSLALPQRDDAPRCLSYLPRLPALTHLSVTRLSFLPSEFASFIQSPNVVGLRSLTLDRWLRAYLPWQEAQELKAQFSAFGAMPSLESLSLIECEYTSDMVARLDAVPSLRSLTLEGSDLPRGTDLIRLLTINSALHCTVRVVDSYSALWHVRGLKASAVSARITVQTLPWRVPRLQQFRDSSDRIRTKEDANRRQPQRACAADSSALRSLDPPLVQRIFHSLSITDRLRLAATSRKLRSLADSPASWAHAMRTVDASALFSLPCLETRLSRHIPLRLQWAAGSTLPSGGLVIFALLHRPELNIRALDCTAASRGEQTDGAHSVNWWVCNQYARLLSRPALLRLRHLRIAHYIDEQTLRPIGALPQLQLLSVAIAKPPAYSRLQKRIDDPSSLAFLRTDQASSLVASTAFPHLHTLILNRTLNSDALLADLQWMPRLRRVVIQPAETRDALPSAASVLRLHTALPHLSCFLVHSESELHANYLRCATALIDQCVGCLQVLTDSSAMLRSDDAATMAEPIDSALQIRVGTAMT